MRDRDFERRRSGSRAPRSLGPRWAALLLALACASPAVAADDEDKPKQREYVLQYVMVVLLTGLGIWGICKPSPRKAEEPPVYGSG